MRYFLFKLFLYLFLLTVNLAIIFIFAPSFLKDPGNHQFHAYLWQIAVYLFVYYVYRLITTRMVTINATIVLLKANIVTLITIFFIVSATKIGEDTSRSILLLYFLLNMLIPFWSYLIQKKVLSHSYFRSKIYVICDQEGLKNLKSWFTDNNPFGYDIETIFDVGKLSIGEIEEKIKALVQSSKYAAAAIDIKQPGSINVTHLIDIIQRQTPRIIIMPKIGDFPMLKGELLSSNFYRGMAFYVKNNLLNPVDQWLKVFFDYIVTLFLIILFSPLLIILYITVFVSTKGHPLFRQKRIGHNGTPFIVYKFRSMHIDAEEKLAELLWSCPLSKKEWEKDFKLKNDPRITPIGSFLRKTSLDELPQLINILRGEMSLVGPRPIVENEIKRYGEYYEYYTAVKPGLTGLWQVSGRNDIEYEERVQLDVWYTRNWSIELDIQILLQTISVVLLRKGSY